MMSPVPSPAITCQLITLSAPMMRELGAEVGAVPPPQGLQKKNTHESVFQVKKSINEIERSEMQGVYLKYGFLVVNGHVCAAGALGAKAPNKSFFGIENQGNWVHHGTLTARIDADRNVSTQLRIQRVKESMVWPQNSGAGSDEK